MRLRPAPPPGRYRAYRCARSWFRKSAPAACGSAAGGCVRFSLPWLQEIGTLGGVRFEPGDCQPTLEGALELFAVPLLDFPRPLLILVPDPRDIGGKRNAFLRMALLLLSLERVVHARRIEPPFGDAAVRGQPAVQRTGGEAILIQRVAAHNGPELLDIEKCVLQLQWIEGPLDEVD